MPRIRPFHTDDWPQVWAILEPVFRAGETYSLDRDISQDQARRLKFRAMQYNLVVSTNEGAVRLWEKLGFRTVGTLPGAFRHPTQGFVDAFVMFKTQEDG